MVHEDAPHQSSRHAVKVLPIRIFQPTLLDKLQKNLAHHHRWLQQVAGLFAAKQGSGNLSQLRVGELKKRIGRRRTAFPPFPKQNCDFAGLLHQGHLFEVIPS